MIHAHPRMTPQVLVLFAAMLAAATVRAEPVTGVGDEAPLSVAGNDEFTPERIARLPRVRLFHAAAGADARVIARRDPQAFSALRSTRSPVVVESFPLADEAPVDLLLKPFRVVGSRTQFVLGRKGLSDVPFDFDASSISLFRGSVLGRAGSHVYLALSDRLSSGYVDLGPGRRRLHISSPAAAGSVRGADDIAVFEQPAGTGLPPGVPLCGVDADLQPHESFIKHPVGVRQRGTSGGTTSTIKLRHLELAVDTDYEYYALFNDVTAATEYLILMYGAVSDIYIRDVDTWVEVVFTRIWTDPNDEFNGPQPLVEDFRPFWTANMGAVQRDVAQLLSGRRDYPFGGQAYLSVLCNLSFGYGVVGYASGFFPDPTRPSPYNFDVPVTAHELGHNCGTGHTHDYGIDTCQDANDVPQRGSIMSYCGQTWSGMNGNTDNYFHSVTRGFMLDHIGNSACIVADCNQNGIADSIDLAVATSVDVNGNAIPDECEDCNGNGTLDPADITGASNDLNTNGIPDECEPDCNGNGVPDDRDIALGTSTDAYANRIPDDCEEDCNSNGISDYTEIQLSMPLDVNRDAALDSCEDCDGDTAPDLVELDSAHFLWTTSGLDNSVLREFHATTGVRTALSSGSGSWLVRGGQDLIVKPSGFALVSSALDDRVMEFDKNGVFVRNLVISGANGLDYPTGLLMMPNGRLLVASRNTNRVLTYDAATGASMGTFVGPGSGGLVAPFGMTWTPDGELLVTSDANEVLRYNGVTGAFLGKLVDAADNGGLSQPRGLSFKRDGNLLVASYGTDEVLEFEWPSGRSLGKWAQVGTATAITQDSPWSIRVGPNGHVYVTRTGAAWSSSPSNDHNRTGQLPGDDVGFSHLTDARMFEYDSCTGLFAKTHIGGNDHGLDFATGFDFIPDPGIDCNFNQLPDDCDLASGFSIDGNGNSVPDECETDCNGNSVFDRLDIIPFGTSFDCNCNDIPDECDVSSGQSSDCNGDGRLDECEPDCNANGEADGCDIFTGFSFDCDSNNVPDDCQPDCNGNAAADTCDLADATSLDCNGNATPDECDAAAGGVVLDVDFEAGLPSGWTSSGFGVTGSCAINPVCDGSMWAYAGGTASCSYGDNQTRTLQAPPIALGESTATLEFCSMINTEFGWDFGRVYVNGDEVFSDSGGGDNPGAWETEVVDLSAYAGQTVTVAFVLTSDGFVSGTLGWQVDNVRVISGSVDCNTNAVPDECEPDQDCDGNGTRDICDIGAGTYADCNENLVPDPCDIAAGYLDEDGNGVLDICENCAEASAPLAELIGADVSVKNRMLSVRGGDPGRDQAVRVTFVSLPPPYDLWNGDTLWASQPSLVSQAGAQVAPGPGFSNFQASILQCNGPEFMDLSALGTLHMFHEGIVPQGSYRVEILDSMCDPACESCFSPALTIATSKLGDTIRDCATIPCPPPEGATNVDDVLAVLARFSNAPQAIVKPRADLEPPCLDLLVNVPDAILAIKGFAGLMYDAMPSAAGACGSTCVNPLP